MPAIINRMTHRLFEYDRNHLKDALIQYMLDHDLDGKDVDPDHYLADQLLTYLVKVSPDWIGLKDNLEWKGSTAYAHVLECLKNQLRNKGYYLNKKIKEVKDEQETARSGQTPADDVTVGRVTRKGKVTGKRTRAKDDKTETDLGSEHAQVKYQKVEPVTKLIPKVKEPEVTTELPRYESEREVNMNNLFREFRLIGGNIQAKRREIAILYEKWQMLKAQLATVWEDSTLDQE